MLNNSLPIGVTPLKSPGRSTPRNPVYGGAISLLRPTHLGESRVIEMSRGEQSIDISSPSVEIAPHRAVTRRGMEWHGMAAEIVQATTQHRVDCRFRSPVHLLAAYEQGARRDGESSIAGVPRSTLRDVAKRLTFVPAGHEYREWHEPRTSTSVTYFYFDPAEIQIDDTDESIADMLLAPRLFFEDATIWSTAAKIRQAIEAPAGANRLYVEALGVVLIHELVRLNRASPRVEAPVRGGLAAWQQRIVTAYVEEHLCEQIPLTTLARLARLSTYHFCRAFKQSFGVPPHRYHTNRRIERAKLMLAERKHSVTEVGLTLGFSETSSFTAVFRKVTGQTPSRYYRNLA
jgi:AraC family transcriptional regulator